MGTQFVCEWESIAQRGTMGTLPDETATQSQSRAGWTLPQGVRPSELIIPQEKYPTSFICMYDPLCV